MGAPAKVETEYGYRGVEAHRRHNACTFKNLKKICTKHSCFYYNLVFGILSGHLVQFLKR